MALSLAVRRVDRQANPDLHLVPRLRMIGGIRIASTVRLPQVYRNNCILLHIIVVPTELDFAN